MATQLLEFISLNRHNYLILSILFPILLLLFTSCSDPMSEAPDHLADIDLQTAETTDEWSVLLGRPAYPFYTPLPPAVSSPIDGTYVKFDPKVATPIPCRRCPDYMNEGGIWKLAFDKGTFRILHLVTGWTGIGSYTVSGNELTIFNDPKCPRGIGYYSWRQVNGDLLIETIDDHCAADMRSHNLEQMVWRRCPIKGQPASGEEQPPPGCQD